MDPLDVGVGGGEDALDAGFGRFEAGNRRFCVLFGVQGGIGGVAGGFRGRGWFGESGCGCEVVDDEGLGGESAGGWDVGVVEEALDGGWRQGGGVGFFGRRRGLFVADCAEARGADEGEAEHEGADRGGRVTSRVSPAHGGSVPSLGTVPNAAKSSEKTA